MAVRLTDGIDTTDECTLTPEDILAGASATFEVPIPSEVFRPVGMKDGDEEPARTVHLRPLTVGTFQLIMKAARNDAGLVPLLMIKESLVMPSLSLEQIKQLHLGLVDFLIASIRTISGLDKKKDPRP